MSISVTGPSSAKSTAEVVLVGGEISSLKFERVLIRASTSANNEVWELSPSVEGYHKMSTSFKNREKEGTHQFRSPTY